MLPPSRQIGLRKTFDELSGVTDSDCLKKLLIKEEKMITEMKRSEPKPSNLRHQ